MGSFSDYLENKVLDHIYGTSVFTPPATVYMGLSTADPTDSGAGMAEPTGNNYARKAIPFAAAANRSIAQNAIVTFNQASGAWGTASHWGVFDQLAGGNMLAYGALTVNKTIVNGNTPSIASGQVVISFNTGAIFTSFANQVLDWIYRGQALPAITVNVGLTSTIPNDSGNVTEPSTGGYVRKAQASWTASSGGSIQNSGATTFDAATGSWGAAIVNAVIFNNSTGGIPLMWGDIEDQTVDIGDTVEFQNHAITITLT